jgi:hypothetical protein
VDPAWALLADDELLADGAGYAACLLETLRLQDQAVALDPVERRLQVGHDLLRADDPDDAVCTVGVRRQLTAAEGGRDDDPSSVMACTLPMTTSIELTCLRNSLI